MATFAFHDLQKYSMILIFCLRFNIVLCIIERISRKCEAAH